MAAGLKLRSLTKRVYSVKALGFSQGLALSQPERAELPKSDPHMQTLIRNAMEVISWL